MFSHAFLWPAQPLTDPDLTALHALSFNETMATYACHASFTFFRPLYTNFDPWELLFLWTLHHIETTFVLRFHTESQIM